ncbi:MAG: 16S rRNA (uracil(1498)-N(3))-methyltransferase, partial [Candidatus Omnitrophica bacterium]|nr:16S rRNA (uracil(1498)-N(3))-methyltransferase [Candidatus Omnitrophota bacterium]
MFRFYSPPENISEDKIIILDKKEIHHLKNVLRLKKDDLVFVFDGQFNEYETKILDLSDSKITLKIINRRILSKRNVEITVASAIPKGKRFDFVVEKLTELGVNRIIPLKTDRSIVNLGEKSLRFRRWQNIILNSCKQSKRVDFLILEPQIEFKDILKRKGEFHLCLIATLSLPGKNLREILKEKTEK